MNKVVNGKLIKLTRKEAAARKAEELVAKKKKDLYVSTRKYADDRAMNYPSIGEQLDAILKQLNYMQMSGQTNLITELDGVVMGWLKVKKDYPKPKQDNNNGN